jgi:hypothetical protein
MGKAHKREKNKLKQQGLLVDKERPHRGPCFVDGCENRGGEIVHCRTCEQLVEAGKRKPEHVFTVQHCALHTHEAQAKAKAHALLAHPYNILRVTASILKGDPL